MTVAILATISMVSVCFLVTEAPLIDVALVGCIVFAVTLCVSLSSDLAKER